MTVVQIAQALSSLGCPAGKCDEMAAQLDRRARQLAETKDRPYDEALAHLLRLMAGGWAAPSAPSPLPEPATGGAV